MARATKLKQGGGGGFLNGVDATLQSILFTDEFNGEEWKAGKIKYTDSKTGKPATMDRPHTLNAMLTFLVDGAENPITVMRKVAGDFDAWEILDEGDAIRPNEDGTILHGSSQFGKFIGSAEESGFPCESDEYPEGTYNFSPLVGQRMRLIQAPDDDIQKEFGKRKGKDGKEYNRTYLAVEQVYAAAARPVGASKGSGKGIPAKLATNGSGKALGAKKGVPAVNEDDDVEGLTVDILLKVLAGAKKPLQKSKLSVPTLTLLKGNPLQKDVYKLMSSDEFLGQELGWTYEKTSQTVSLDT